MRSNSFLKKLSFKHLMYLIRLSLNSSLGRNILSLYALQFANYILPMITVPYLVRVLGPDKFGAVAFGLGLMNYFALIVNYGFNWSATRTISVLRDDRDAVSMMACSVWIAKLILCIGSLAVAVILIYTIPRLRDESTLFYLLFGVVLGNALFPTWLFQGLERMVSISVINFIMRVITTSAVFLIVRDRLDYLVYAGLVAFQWFGAGVLGVFWALRSLRIRFVWPEWRDIKSVFLDGWMLFLSTTAVSLYTTGNSFILGMLTTNTAVGYYSAAEKLVKAVQGLLGPVSQAVYPKFSKVALESQAETMKLGRKILLLMGGLGMILSVGLFVGAPYIVHIMLGPGYESSIMVMRFLSPLPLLISLSNVLGRQIMLSLGFDRDFTVIIFGAGLINLLFATLLAPSWQDVGMAVAVLISEAFVTLMVFVYLVTRKLNPIAQILHED